MKYTLRDLIWLTVVVGLMVTCVLQYRSIFALQRELATWRNANRNVDQSRERAIELARRYSDEQVRTKQMETWGEPIDAVAGPHNTFRLFYATPAKEHQLLGDRVIIVQMDYELVGVVMRQ